MSQTIPTGTRVRVNITKPERYAMGAAEALHGMTGKIERFSPQSACGDPDPGPAYVVAFDTAAPTWWTNQTPSTSFWFPPSELVVLP